MKRPTKGFFDWPVCPHCNRRRWIIRQGKSEGKTIRTFCDSCHKHFPWLVVRKPEPGP